MASASIVVQLLEGLTSGMVATRQMMGKLKGSHAMLALALGISGALVALHLAIHVVGPTTRQWLGVPVGFGEDYATKEAWRQARVIQILSLAAVFFVVGLASGVAKCSKPLAWSFWAANPFSVGLAYWLYQRLCSGSGPGEYFGFAGLALLAAAAPLVFAPCVLLGIRIGRVAQPQRTGMP